MANTIQHKRSSTATTVPTAGQLSAGELAVNTADGKLYLKKDNATIVQIGGPVAAVDLTGATLASGVTASSLTSVGTLTGLTLSGNVNLQDNVLSCVELLDYFERYSDLGDFTTKGTQIPIDLSTGQVFRTKITVACTGLDVTNTPDNGNANAVGFTFLLVGDGTARTMTWNIGVTAVTWAGGTAPTYTSTLNKIDVFSFLSRDGGSTWLGFVGGQNF